MKRKRIGILTSGGDAPGMNAAIRAATRALLADGAEPVGILHGYAGLVAGDARPLDDRAVGGIVQRGGTLLGTRRCPEFATAAALQQAVATLERLQLDGLIIIGGNGSQAGAAALHALGVSVAGVASTIDNDIPGCDITIGVDSALNVALEAIDRLKTTASSHQRAFLVEVMGRDCGTLALAAAVAGGAEAVIIPEIPADPEALAEELRAAWGRGKAHAIVVVAEGAQWNAARLQEYFRAHGERLGFELRTTVLGHVQRGGSPTAFDRLLASRLGAAAAERMLQGQGGVLAGWAAGKVNFISYDKLPAGPKALDPELLMLAKVLAR